jgi:hypothetical protein
LSKSERTEISVAAIPPEWFWSELRGAAEDEGKPIGWAAHRFEDQYGRSPDRAWNSQPTRRPSKAVLDFIEEREAAYAKSKRQADDEDIPFR